MLRLVNSNRTLISVSSYSLRGRRVLFAWSSNSMRVWPSRKNKGFHTTTLAALATAALYYGPFHQRSGVASAFVPTSVFSRNSSTLLMNGAPSPSTAGGTTTTCAASASTDATTTSVLAPVQEALQATWVRQLSAELEENFKKSQQQAGHGTNHRQRPIFNGHYVLVQPTPLPEPRLVLYSKDVASDLLGLTEEQVESDDFVQWMSGNRVLQPDTWATPYALSIMGQRYTHNCPYGTDHGYGDGRAISLGDLHGYELQLKGAGTTPFHRGADGRAVLRSSLREFLASEAMHYLGVSTTRALSLVVSETDKIRRPWYSDGLQLKRPEEILQDERLAQYSDEQKQQLLVQLRNEKADPNLMIQEPTAITCRVAPSFVRIGHLDLFARRVEQASQRHAQALSAMGKDDEIKRYDTSSNEWKELTEMVWHACFREYKETAYDPYFESNDIEAAATALLEGAAEKIATMVAGWIRVGFAQGNFNADNCLVGGRTMDYGPFGFLEEYNPLFAKWTGSGEHFGFLNQPSAGYANYHVLVTSVVPVIAAARGLDQDPEPIVDSFLEKARPIFQNKVNEVFRTKLGFETDQDVGDDLWQSLEPLMLKTRTDWTLFFRQLTTMVENLGDDTTAETMLGVLEGDESARPGSSVFYEPLKPEQRQEWLLWLEQWRDALLASTNDQNASFEHMRLVNPKFVLREWMMVEAYKDAAEGNEALLFDLYNLIQHPYEEGNAAEIKRYYRRASDEALRAGGTAFMS